LYPKKKNNFQDPHSFMRSISRRLLGEDILGAKKMKSSLPPPETRFLGVGIREEAEKRKGERD
jgi:hypothetical protein